MVAEGDKILILKTSLNESVAIPISRPKVDDTVGVFKLSSGELLAIPIARPEAENEVIVIRLNSGELLAFKVSGGETYSPFTNFINIPCWAYDSMDIGTWALYPDSSQEGGFVIRNSTANNLDAVSYRTWMDAGTYVVKVICKEGPDYGYLAIDIDGENVNMLDAYNSGILHNVVLAKYNLVVAESGLKVITLRVQGKWGTSGGYKLAMSSILAWRRS